MFRSADGAATSSRITLRNAAVAYATNFSIPRPARYAGTMANETGRGAVRTLIGAISRVPPLVKAGAACGMAGGVAVGAMVSTPSVGLACGIIFGTCAGIVCGIVMDRDDKRAGHRTRELDEIIGITGGSMGTPRGSIPPPDTTHADELRHWASEWLTPPPPQAR